MSYEKNFNELDASYQGHLKEQEIIKQITAGLQKKAKDLIGELYAREIHMLSAEGYKALEGKIYTHASDLAVEITTVFYHHKEDNAS